MGWEEADDADNDDEEVNPVPRITQVSLLMPNEAHSDDLNYALYQEDNRKNDVDVVQYLVPLGLVACIVILLVILRG